MKSWSMLPCPFCGGKPELRVAPNPLNDSHNNIIIRCPKCNTVQGPRTDGIDIYGHTIETSEVLEKVVSLWNKRVDESKETTLILFRHVLEQE